MKKEVLKFLREHYQMNQRDFATTLNCSYSLIALIEVGKRNVSANLENKIKKTFNLTDEQLTSISTFIDEAQKGIPPII